MAEYTIPPRFLALADLPAWLEELSGSRQVYCPQRQGTAVVYRKFVPGVQPDLERRPTESAKHVLFPRAEGLFTFSRQPSPEQGGRVRTTVDQPDNDPEPTVIFGALSCDARGFLNSFDPVYDGRGTEGKAPDVYYLKRRERTAFITRACRTALTTCFCPWTGGDPAGTQGVDVRATDITGGFLLEPLTGVGAELLSSPRLKEAGPEQIQEGLDAHQAVRESMGPVPDLTPAPKALLDVFSDDDFWLKQSAGCISCGGCTYLCPTCYCFNITDQSNGVRGVRLRSWDACMFPLYTQEASGHNPRAVKAARLRNRVGHKYSYYPEIHQGIISCTGCGRCIKSCPSSIDIRKIVLNAISAAQGAKEAANV